jgi:PKD repeat protein
VAAAIPWEGPAWGQDPSTNSYIDFGWPTPTQRVYYTDMLACLTNMTNNCYAHLAPGWYTYVKSNAIPGGPGAFRYLVPLGRLTNFVIAGSPGTRFIFDNTCTTDSPNTTVNFINADGAANFSISGLEVESKRRVANSATNFNFDVLAMGAVTNVTIQHVWAQVDSYVTNANHNHADAFLVAVSGDSHNLVMDTCQFGMLVPPSLYNAHTAPDSSFAITHGNHGDLTFKDCVSYGTESVNIYFNNPGDATPSMVNFRVRYPGALASWLFNIWTSQFTNVVEWFNEQENLSYYLPGTDPAFIGYDQYTNLDAVTVYFPSKTASASFTAAPTNGVVPLTVTFTDASVGSITNWFWSFGDGATTNATTPGMQHTYTTAGTYSTSEIIAGLAGSSTATQANNIAILTPVDAWLTRYFNCTNCPQSQMSADADGTGQNNLFKYVAGLDPTNPASRFVLQIQNVPNQPTHKNLIYGPITSGCTYVVESTTDAAAGVWSPQPVSAPLTNGARVMVTDPNATAASKFYRINIYNIITNLNLVVSDSVGDGIPDSWRAQYFPTVPSDTTNAQSCAACDADGTGQNNLFKYAAGLDPTNPASVFVLSIVGINGLPAQKNLIFNPLAASRTYTTQFTTNLVGTVYATLTGIGGPTTNGDQVTVTDPDATQTNKFYRIHITYP